MQSSGGDSVDGNESDVDSGRMSIDLERDVEGGKKTAYEYGALNCI